MTTKIKASRIDQTQAFSFANVVANTITVTAGIIANGTLGSAGDLLVSNGTHAYWKSSAQLIPSAVNGDKGDKGDKGDAGTSGTKGDLGTTGAKGDKGDGSSITLAGSDTQLQYNDDGVLGASENLTYNSNTSTLTTTNLAVSNVAGIVLPTGNTTQRVNTPGIIRYNSQTGFAEVYTAGGWGTFGAVPPSAANVTPTTFNGAIGTEFTINGSFFTSDAAVVFINAAGTEYTAAAVAFVNTSVVRVTTSRNFIISDEPLSVKLTQASGSTTVAAAIDCGSTPTWTTSSGTLTTAYYPGVPTVNTSVVATDTDANTVITYAVTTGSLPSGLTLDASTGNIAGNVANPNTSSLTTTFSITASDQAGNPSTARSFNIISKWQDGSTSAQAAPNANVIFNLSTSFQSANATGIYWIKLPGQSSASQVYCNMDSRVGGGGWMLIFGKTSSMSETTYKQLWYSNTAWNNTTATQDSVLYPVLPNGISFGGQGFTKQMFNNQHPSWISAKGNYHWYDLQTDVNWTLSGSKIVNSFVVSTNTATSATIYNRQQAWSGGSDSMSNSWGWWADSGNGGLCGGANQCGTLACPVAGPSEGCHTNSSYPMLIYVR